MSGNTPKIPTASGARLAGDDYQHLYTWFHALHLLREAEGVTRVEFEVREAGNVDDLVVYRRTQAALYHQIKFVVDQRELLTHDWFTTVTAGGKASPLQRFHSSFGQLGGEHGSPEMALYTNRQLASGDPVLQRIDSRTDKLGPRLLDAGPHSAAGKARREWADHLGISEDELREMLSHLRIYPGRGSLEDLRKSCGIFMEAVGLRGDIGAVSLGTNEIRQLIISGCSALEIDDMRDLVGRLGLTAITPRGTLLIQAIDHNPWPETATAHVDWVDEFVGNDPRERRQLHEPERWNTRLKEELAEAAAAVRRQGFEHVRIDGAFRLSTGFAAGAALPRAAGLTVTFRDWASNAEPTEFPVITREYDVDQGDEFAVATCVTSDITEDVLAYIEQAQLPVAKLVTITPSSGVGQTAIPSKGAAVGFVYAAFDEIRRAACQHSKLHVFQGCPNGISVLIGHLWNRVPATQLYDDANSPELYFPTFLLVS